jgi:branched-chain amino acid transport system ATP-binding protein
VLLVEQQARQALSVADRWYLLNKGTVVAEGSADGDPARLEAVYVSSLAGTSLSSLPGTSALGALSHRD